MVRRPIHVKLEERLIKEIKRRGSITGIVEKAVKAWLHRGTPETPTLKKELSELKAKYEKLKESKGVKKYSFINKKWPKLKCSVCKELTFNKRTFGQEYADGSKTYFCVNCRFEAGSDPRVYRRGRKLRQIDAELREGGKELRQLDADITQREERLKEIGIYETLNGLYERICAMKKPSDQSSQIFEAIAVLRDLRDSHMKKKTEAPLETAPKPLYKKIKKTLPAHKVRCGLSRYIVDRVFCERECKHSGNCPHQNTALAR